MSTHTEDADPLIAQAHRGDLQPIRQELDRLHIAINADPSAGTPQHDEWADLEESAIQTTYPRRTSQRDRSIAVYRITRAWANALGIQ